MTETKTKKEKSYVGIKEPILFGIANGGQCFGYNMFCAYLTLFLVNAFGIPEGAVATMVLVLGIWDTVNDPIMGSIIDKTRTRYGKLRPYLLFVPLPLAVTTILFWCGPLIINDPKQLTLKIIYMYVSYLLWEFFYTLGDVPFWSMSAAISPNPNDRTKVITGGRLISGIISALSTTFLLPILIDLSDRGKIGWSLKEIFAFVGFIAGLFALFVFGISGFAFKERVVQKAEETKILDSFKYMFKSKPLVLIILSNLLGTLSASCGIFSTYYFREVLSSMSSNSILSLVTAPFGLLGYVLLPILKKKFDNKQLTILNSLVSIVSGILAFFICFNHYETWYFVIPVLTVRNCTTSLFGSINMIVSTEMIADAVDFTEWKIGIRNEGMAFSVLTFVGKMNNRIATAIGTSLLPIFGYIVTEIKDPKTGLTDTVGQCTSAFGHPTKFWLWAFMTIVPGILSIITIVPYLFYDLDKSKLAMIREELEESRKLLAESSKTNETEAEAQ